jgi:hypothetical protein
MTIQKNNIKNPNAAVIIYNYNDRFGSTTIPGDKHDVDRIILNTVSLISVSTSKAKSSPAGGFEIRLAPIKNWVTSITPGSWCVILMSNNNDIDDTAKYGGGKVKEETFKMLGRVESVRAVTGVNQTTGARETQYIVTGTDWGNIFFSNLYLDPLLRSTDSKNSSALGTAMKFGYGQYIREHLVYGKSNTSNKDSNSPIMDKTNITDNTKEVTGLNDPAIQAGLQGETNYTLPSATDNINFILQLWGQDDRRSKEVEIQLNKMEKSKHQFRLPIKLAEYMRFTEDNNISGSEEATGVNIANLINVIGGRLTGYDTYKGRDPSAGPVDMNTILGDHVVWSVLKSNSNPDINELISDIRFVDGKPTLALYNRIKPFVLNKYETITRDLSKVGDGIGLNPGDAPGNLIRRTDQQQGLFNIVSKPELIRALISEFKNIKTIKIDRDDVILTSYGTNWRDRVNFIDILPAISMHRKNVSHIQALAGQFIDEDSIGRDGLLSLHAAPTYLPTLEDGTIDMIGLPSYKYILKEWFFNTHKMLNGTLQLIGQDKYIQVGDNIKVDADVINETPNINSEQYRTRKNTYMLAHVESISHEIRVGNDGTRTFLTNIDFVRGIIVDENNNEIVSRNSTETNTGAIDQDSKKTTDSIENNLESFGTSTNKDIDRQRLRGD